MRSPNKIIFYLFVLIFFSHFGVEDGLSQTIPKEDGLGQIRLRNVTFQTREIESTPSNLKILEIHIEIFNRSQRFFVPPNSIKVVVVPKEVKFSSANAAGQFPQTSEEVTLPPPLPPRTGRVLVIGFPIPKEKLESITFEVQINPPEGEKQVARWEEAGIK